MVHSVRSATSRALLLLVGLPLLGSAQQTGAFEPFVGPRVKPTAAERSRFQVLMTDPLLSSTMRLSAWTATLASMGNNSEARLQANLCDLGRLAARCAASGRGYDLTLAGPLTRNATVTDLADLQGLAGTNRLELGVRTGVLNATRRPSFSLRAAFGYPIFDYRAGTDLTPTADRHPIGSVMAGVGFKNTKWSASAGYRIESSYKAQDPEFVCSPAPFGTATTVCEQYVLNGPTHETRNVFSVDTRVAFASAGATGAMFSFDNKRHVWGAEVPFWVVPQSVAGFGAGVRFGYRSDTRRGTAAFFVSAFRL
jgi:hypothetical protein